MNTIIDLAKIDIDWYFIGLWLGDGDSSAVSITSADQEIIAKAMNEYYGC